MSTDFLALFDTGSQAGALSHLHWNDLANAVDRIGEALFRLRIQGPLSGWALPETSTISQINRGYGMIGAQYCETAASETISGLQAGTNYVHLTADPSAGWAGGVNAKARATSTALLNADGTSSGIILGTLGWAALTGVQESTANSTLRQNGFQLRGHQQTVTLSMTAGASSVISTAYAWSTPVFAPTLSAQVSLAASQHLQWDTLAESGGLFRLQNTNSNAGTTYTGALILRGLLR
jgi:hypothetical protein